MSNTADPRSYIDRVLRLKEEADTLAEDAREVYREATANGLNQKALSQAVGVIRKRAKHGDKQADLEATTAEYVDAYYGDTKAPTRARAAHAPARDAAAEVERLEGMIEAAGGIGPALSAIMGDDPPHDPQTGELTEPVETASPAPPPPDVDDGQRSIPSADAAEAEAGPAEPDTHRTGQSAQAASTARGDAGPVPDFLRRSDKGCNAMGVG